MAYYMSSHHLGQHPLERPRRSWAICASGWVGARVRARARVGVRVGIGVGVRAGVGVGVR